MADFYGTDLDETITGASTDDRLFGRAGADKLRAKSGNDWLYGEAGNDSLNGEGGADLMFGGSGDDTYYVDNAGDVVSEETVAGVDDGGSDRVYSKISYALPAFVERLTLSAGAGAIDATGNALDNTLTGNEYDNILTGGGGKDTLIGGLGADTFVFRSAYSDADEVVDFATEDWVGISAADYGLSEGNGLISDGTTLVLDPAYFTTARGSSASIQGTAIGHGQFVHNQYNGKLYWDPDGAGPAGCRVIAILDSFNDYAPVSAANFKILDAPPVVGEISITGFSLNEGATGTQTATFTVSRSGTAAFAVNYTTADGTATAGSDYVATSGTLTFAAGEVSKTITVAINGDTAIEDHETFFVNLSGATNGGIIVNPQGVGTIRDEDGVGEISISDVQLTEGDSGTQTATFTVSRTGPAPFAVDYATANNNAIAGSDYVATSGTLTFAANEASKEISVTVNGDTEIEGDSYAEWFWVNLSGATNGGTIVDGQGIGSIINDDGLNFRVSGSYIREGDSGTQTTTFTVRRMSDTAPSVVTYATADGTATAGSDYVATSGTLTFAPSEEYKTITVTINGDTIQEASENFFVNLSDPTTGIPLAVGETRIIDDDRVGNISVMYDFYMLWEDTNDRANVHVKRTDGSAPFSVNYATADGSATAVSDYAAGRLSFLPGSATAGSDYVATSGTLSFAAGEVEKTFSVRVKPDTTPELNELFFVNISNATNGGIITDGQTGVVLLDDDGGLPTPGNIYIDDVTIAEGNSDIQTATFTVTRSGTAAFAVNYTTADGSATAGTDYVATTGTLSFAAGEAYRTITVTINGDTVVEGNEGFWVQLSNASNGGTIVDGQGGCLITNDDVPPPPPRAPTVVAIHDTTVFGSPDPSGLAYVPASGTLLLSDSEVDESPFYGSNNLFALSTDGTLKPDGAMSLLSFSKEPTGLAFDPSTGHLLVSDDRSYKVFWVDPADPTVKRGEFLTKPIGGSDPEDITVHPGSGHLFICNGSGNTNTPGIIETDRTGTQIFDFIAMPTAIPDPKALAYDAVHDLFYVGGKYSTIWVIDRDGTILETIDILDNYPRPNGGARAKVTDLELAPSSDPTDDPGKLNLYVADYGADQVNDGRLFEIELGDPFWA